MASNGNQPPIFNINWPAAIAGAQLCQLAQQTPFTSQPFLPQLLHNLTGPQSSQNSNPLTCFIPSTSQLSQSILGPAPDFQQNISDNSMLTSQIAALQAGYELRIRELNQEICRLKLSEQQKLFNLEVQCTKLNALKCRLEHENLTLDQEKRDLEAQCTKLNGELLKKDTELKALNDVLESQTATLQNDYESRVKQLNQEICHIKLSGQQKLLNLEAKCTKLNDVVVGKNSELKALENRLEFKNLTVSQEKEDLKVQCANLNDELLKKISEVETLNDLLKSQSLTFGQEKKDLEAQCAIFNDELLKMDSELDALKQSKNVALQDGESRVRESRIRELNREVRHLKSSEKQKLSFLEAECTELKRKLLEENSRLEGLNDMLQSQTLTLGREKRDLEAHCAKLNDELLKKDSEVETSKANLQIELHRLSVELQKGKLKLAKVEEENLELKVNNERNFSESQLKMNQMESEKVANANSLAVLSEAMAEIERDYISFVNSFSSQISKLKEKNKKLEEENEMLRADHTANKTKIELDTCQADLENAIDDMRRVIEERDLLQLELKSASANSVDLNATIVLNDAIDQTKTDSDDKMIPPNSKKKRK